MNRTAEEKKQLQATITVWLRAFIVTLLVIFIALKLDNRVDWSWLWVLSPVWIPAAFGFALLVIAGILYVIAGVLSFFEWRSIEKARKKRADTVRRTVNEVRSWDVQDKRPANKR